VLAVVGDDPRHQRLERLIPAVLLGVDHAMPADYPAEVADSQRTQHNPALAPRVAEHITDSRHRVEQSPLFLTGKPFEHCLELACRTLVESLVRRTPGSGEPDHLSPRIRRRTTTDDQAVGFIPAKDAAEISRIKPEPSAQGCDRDLLPLGEFEDHPGLGERVGGVEQALIKDTNHPRVETVELTDRCHRVCAVLPSHRPMLRQTFDSVND
jgi:hypothetical protein